MSCPQVCCSRSASRLQKVSSICGCSDVVVCEVIPCLSTQECWKSPQLCPVMPVDTRVLPRTQQGSLTNTFPSVSKVNYQGRA